MRVLVTTLLLASAGCSMTPIPSAVGKWHQEARRDVPALEQIVKPGDILFRLSGTQLAGGLIDFSKTVAKNTESQLSHATLVYRVEPDGVVVVDMTPTGIARRYLSDWYMDGSANIAVCRLKPEYAHLIPQVLAEAEKLVARHVLYDDKFDADNDRFYCTEVVDYCFRKVGHPLAPRIRIKDFPRYDLVMHIGCMVGGIDNQHEVAIAGNERIGLFSSPLLEPVLDWRGRKPGDRPAEEPFPTFVSNEPTEAAAAW